MPPRSNAQRTSKRGHEIFSRLEKITVGTDPDGDDITSLVIVPTEGSPLANKKLSGAHQRALDALCEALLDFGIVPPPNNHIPRQNPDNFGCPVERGFLRQKRSFPAKKEPDYKAFVRAVRKTCKTLKSLEFGTIRYGWPDMPDKPGHEHFCPGGH